MATLSVGGGAAEGIQAGFGMGLQLDRFNEEKRARQFEETRQTAADSRAADELTLRQKREQREQEVADDATQQRGVNALLGRQKAIITAGQQAQLNGQPLDPTMVDEYGKNAALLKQTAKNWVSRLQTGKVDLDAAPARDVYANMSAATGMNLADMKALPQGVDDWKTGMDTGNHQLMLKGANTIMAPRLRMGIGDDDPNGSGGKIVSKQLLDISPARDGNGVDHPDKFIPIIRTTVKLPDGSTKYYDAPSTLGGTTDPNAPVQPVSIQDAMDFVGHAGNFATAMSHPALMSKLEQGAKELDTEHVQALDELTNLTRPTMKPKQMIVHGGNKNTLVNINETTGKVIGQTEYGVGATPRNFNPNTGGGGTLRAQLRALDEDKANGTYDDDPDQYEQDRHDIIMRAGRTPAGAGKGPSSAEINSIGNDAANRAASTQGLHYDKTAGVYKDSTGTRATADQMKTIDAAREGALTVARNNAAKGKRTSGDEVTTAVNTAAPAGKPKYQEGQTATGPNGAKMVFKGGVWQALK